MANEKHEEHVQEFDNNASKDQKGSKLYNMLLSQVPEPYQQSALGVVTYGVGLGFSFAMGYLGDALAPNAEGTMGINVDQHMRIDSIIKTGTLNQYDEYYKQWQDIGESLFIQSVAMGKQLYNNTPGLADFLKNTVKLNTAHQEIAQSQSAPEEILRRNMEFKDRHNKSKEQSEPQIDNPEAEDSSDLRP
ncbi:hypothetical protein [Legionella bononiensis]|uniref:Uncharacterized protein n=1 Tax=Legionella bononiensis TaxID=2793102 RepID=A0ABS1W779_9GAMM|nr:hypothetical protein [Legionella bononiensis]MBL7481305.1 hypothetical protein [Legionella bononiensis]MBL7525209.1 hypothetical protein [Legionella bononiensis]MBL7561392.1 hypothetical protein [Legionella bononiensis]